MNAWEQVEQALNDAEQVERAARHHANAMARLLAGSLRSKKVSGQYLEALKRELRDYNIHTGCWATPD